MIFNIIGGTREVEVPASLSLGKGKLYGLTSKAGAPDGTEPTRFGSASVDGRLVMPNTLGTGDAVIFGRKGGGSFGGKLLKLTGDVLELDTPEPEAKAVAAKPRTPRAPKATAPKADISTETKGVLPEAGPVTADKPKAE